ncbi:unnamed protein product [Cuscuta epithymum]|uniref:Integrase catalytic domain-containing protein n=1 Tax=Cuscuta epithymum TaxID=186058 RepID=A0AAV0DRL9_9ASTE|nr:unnamed protein product [Cuscuta epithymum]CAH9140733.1 unnamed protein product [Cuscuta epithymum]
MLGDNTALDIKGVGNVPLRMFDGVVRVIQNVRWVPFLRRNLLSESVFDDLGCTINTQDGYKVVSRNGNDLIKANKSGGLYLVNCSPELNLAVSVNNSTTQKQTEIWHNRLGHIGNVGLNKLFKTGFFDFKPVNLGFCENCTFGKKTRHSFEQSSYVASAPLELVHSDLWGPSKVSTTGGRKYFLSLVDHFSRKVWIFLLKTKDETFENFKNWKTLVESQSNFKLKALKTDNGLEFCNNEFNGFCKNEGIKRLLTVPGTPQQNGTAERMNRTLLEKARCMLISSGLGNSLWGEAVVTASYLVNRSPSSVISFKTPQEMWSGIKPNISHLRPFGCAAYAHVSQGKLQPRALKCVMLGYPEGIKGYKLLVLQPGAYKCIVSRDVTFNECDFPCKRTDTTSSKYAGVSDGNFFESLDDDDSLYKEDHSGILHNDANDYSESDTDQQDDLNGGEQVVVSSDSQGSNSGSHTTSVHELTDTAVNDNVHVDNNDTDNHSTPNLADYQLVRDREPRTIIPNKRYFSNLAEFVMIAAEVVKQLAPDNFEQAMMCPKSNEWMKAMQEELQSMYFNRTWTLVPKPKNAKVIDCRWIFRLKDSLDPTEPPKFKARLVAKGFRQKEGIDYQDIFAPVIKFKTLRLMLAITTVFDWELEQMDVKTAFLHGDLKETIFMSQPPGFINKEFPEHVCLLKKSIYGLKQSPRQWNLKFDSCMSELGFLRSKYDTCLYYKHVGTENVVYILLYVDDILLIGPCKMLIVSVKDDLKLHFDMKDIGSAKRILGIDITRDRSNRSMFLSQGDYLNKILDRFNMNNSKSTPLPLGGHLELSRDPCPMTLEESEKMAKIPYDVASGSLMYAMLCTRPDLAFAVSILSRFMSDPRIKHWTAMKYTLRYLSGTKNLGLKYFNADLCDLKGFVDSDYAGCKDSRKSTTSWFFTWAGNCISWKSQLQSVVALSTTEAEYIAATEAIKEAKWLKGILGEVLGTSIVPTVFSDSQSAIYLCKDPMYHEKTKHIDVRFHYIRDEISKGNIKIDKITGDVNPADFGTKIVPVAKFLFCRQFFKVFEVP